MQDSILKMEEYNQAMKATVGLQEAAGDVDGDEPHLGTCASVYRVSGGCRPITGSEARTILAQYVIFHNFEIRSVKFTL